MKYTARSLCLLRAVATEFSGEQIDKKLTQSFTDLMTPGMGDRRPVLRRLNMTIRVNQLRHTREVLPGGGWRGDTMIGAMTTAAAGQVLTEPHRWPVEIVGDAIQHATSRLTPLETIGQVAHRQRWFEEP